MSGILKFSEATALALHTMVILAANQEKALTAREMAVDLNASEAHLAKVLQRLARARLTRSFRGPGGGFVLARPAEEIALLEVYQAIEGPLNSGYCLFDEPVCNGGGCILGGLLHTVNTQVKSYLSETKLAALSHLKWRNGQHVKENC